MLAAKAWYAAQADQVAIVKAVHLHMLRCLRLASPVAKAACRLEPARRGASVAVSVPPLVSVSSPPVPLVSIPGVVASSSLPSSEDPDALPDPAVLPVSEAPVPTPSSPDVPKLQKFREFAKLRKFRNCGNSENLARFGNYWNSGNSREIVGGVLGSRATG